MHQGFYKNIKQHNFYIENNNNDDNNKKMFFEHQISILERFLIDHVTLKTGVMMCVRCDQFKCFPITAEST